ncbi:MAG: DUF1800 family protein [Rhodanobacteraceae bacterium]|nr:DUF1800 family protein [Xanthomonadales bacterium]MCP5478138.1 DUF1800 family protein [Rhodanobacteraceae bacterium]HPF72874.1 DUF1800 family protein [Xanthomonadaceae bacterium]HRX99115.1 DUF1800 family protein [Xanthomonadaceae bacterium]
MLHQRWGCLLLLCLGLLAALPVAAQDAVFSDSFEGFELGPNSDEDAARFLDQASFGGRLEDIAHVRAIGYEAWLAEQFAAPVSELLPFLEWVGQSEGVYQQHRLEAWLVNAAQLYDPASPSATHDDQLRQRVAFALSEIMVVSDRNAALLFQPYALGSYYDMLAHDAFGNFRDLLEDVTLHPAMGKYLSMLGNRKNDPVLNIRPDENYAREVLQLFSVGLYRLNPDGSRMLDLGEPIPTYDQNVVRGFAHVFTGWNFAGCNSGNYDSCAPGNPDDAEWQSPMQAVEAFHDTTTSKQLLDYPGVALPGGVLGAGGNAQQELDAALDNIFNHPNVGPFIGHLLIQRLVTSNPSPAYVQRVAAAFNDNGSGVRGDMQAVVRAILLDEDARTGQDTAPTTFGKLREPFTKLVRVWRVAPAHSVNGRVFRWSHPSDEYGQLPLSSPSVFNFFKPDFAQPGEIRNSGRVSPEFQIATDTQLVSAPNELGWRIFYFYVGSHYSVVWENNAPVPEEALMDYTALKTLAADPAALVDHLNLTMMSGQMSDYMRDLLITRLQGTPPDNLPGQPGGAPMDIPLFRVQQALYLIVNSPEFNVQK